MGNTLDSNSFCIDSILAEWIDYCGFKRIGIFMKPNSEYDFDTIKLGLQIINILNV